MPRLQSRPFATPDDVRTFPHGSATVLRLDESVVGRAVYEPGWRWTVDMPEIAGWRWGQEAPVSAGVRSTEADNV